MKTKLLGSFGEEKAVRHLRKNGYTIIDLNFSSRFGEIDIIAAKGRILAFVEVKMRKDDHFAAAREFVDYRKQQRIKTTAQIWLSVNEPEADLQPRFDVCEVYASDVKDKNFKLNYIENAF